MFCEIIPLAITTGTFNVVFTSQFPSRSIRYLARKAPFKIALEFLMEFGRKMRKLVENYEIQKGRQALLRVGHEVIGDQVL